MKKNVYDNLGNVLFWIETTPERISLELNMQAKSLDLIENEGDINLFEVHEKVMFFKDLKGNEYLVDESESCDIEILRVENHKGVGPYRDGSTGDIIQSLDFGYSLDKNPLPTTDLFSLIAQNLINKSIVKYGFLNEEQLEAWFDFNQMQILNKHGFFVKKCRVKRCFLGKNQVVFEE